MNRKTILLGAIAIGVIATVVYQPSLKIQFYNGWWYLIWSATMDFPRYLLQFFDPSNITQGYRPVQGLYMYLLYNLFHFNPDGYHWGHDLLHAANAVLVFLIVGRLSKRWRPAFLTAVLYTVMPDYSLAVFWTAVVDPLAGFFYLLTLLLWTRFLETRHRLDYLFTFITFILALLSKEISIFLPVFLFLIEWYSRGTRPNLRDSLPRYLPFLVPILPYVWLVYLVQSHGEFVGQFGYQIGPQMVNHLLPYAAVLTFPWKTDMPIDPQSYLWLGVVVIAYIAFTIHKRSTGLLFLALFAVLNVSPLLAFPLEYFNTRYLYLSTIVSAILLAFAIEAVWNFFRTWRWFEIVLIASITIVVSLCAARVAESAYGLAEYTRQTRVPFNDIARQHPTFPPNTYVYFVNSPKTSIWDFEGLFFARYGKNVTVNATDGDQPPNLRAYAAAFVYYFDSSEKPVELAVDKDILTRTTAALPVHFDSSIVLDRYTLPSNTIRKGQAFVTVFEWHVSAVPTKDYTIFAHLLDAQGRIITQSDSLLASVGEKTSLWRPTRHYVDAIVLPIDANILPGTYRLEIGLYDATTLARLSTAEESGQPIADSLIIEPLNVLGD